MVNLYKSNNGGLGGGINTSDEFISGDPNNLFPVLSKADSDTGVTRYQCFYIRNENSFTMEQFQFWQESGTSAETTTMQWAKGKAGKNGTEVAIADIYTAPAGVTTWKDPSSDPLTLGNLEENDYHAIWLRNTIEPNTQQQRSDEAVFKFKSNIPDGAPGQDPDPSGGGTGGSGGNPSPTPADYKIAVVGDWGCTGDTDDVMDLCENYNLVISVGDMSYESDSGSADCFTDRVDDHNLKSKFVEAYGNHDWSQSGCPEHYKNYFGHGKTYHYRKFQNIAIITIDSNDDEIDASPGSAQHDQIETWLEQAENDADVDWIFASMHNPWFGSGSDHDNNEGNVVQSFMELFQQHEVAFVFTGHNHNWQRTHKVAFNSSDPENPDHVDTSSPYTNDGDGLIHVVSGCGGHDDEGSLYDLDDAIGEGDNPNAYQNNSNLGIFEILASNSGQTLTCSFVNLNGDKSGTFTYTK